MDKIKVIQNEEDYKKALSLVEELMSRNPTPDSDDGEKLSLLGTLVEDYEAKVIPESLPDPIDAILFRMEQANLKPIDLVKYIGSRGKVSEILSRKRPLTLAMIRSLQSGLGIPAKVLVKESDKFRDTENIPSQSFPLKEMEKRGYFGKSLTAYNAKNILDTFFRSLGSTSQVFAMLRKTSYRTYRTMDKQAMLAWVGYIANEGKKIKFTKTYKKGIVGLPFMQKVVQLSSRPNGPIEAVAFLKEYGIGLVIEKHFPKTYVDGIVLLENKSHPIIGMSLRHDRLDNFWFTLMHELAHIALHYDSGINLFYDDLDNPESKNELEEEADKYAKEALVPENKWQNSPARLIPSPLAAESLAKELGIHVAIVAGKMRQEGNQYQYLGSIVNQAKVRQYFPNKTWD
ncbi:MAG: ImmA/IrrE family metallo-endopeptidase [Patescibacteria group bacterium]